MRRNPLNHNKLINILYSQCRWLDSEKKLDGLHKLIYKHLSAVLPLDAFYIGYQLPEQNALSVRFLMDGEIQLPSFTESLSNTIAGLTMKRKDVVFFNTADEIRQALKARNMKAFGQDERLPQAIICSPILASNKPLGVMSAQSYEPLVYSPEAAKLLFIVATQCAPSLQMALQVENGFTTDSDSDSNGQSSFASNSSYLKIADQNEKFRSVINLARRICHEMNQPLTGISGYCALIREELTQDHHAFEDLSQIEIQAQRLEQLIYNFQNIAQMEDADDPNTEL